MDARHSFERFYGKELYNLSFFLFSPFLLFIVHNRFHWILSFSPKFLTFCAQEWRLLLADWSPSLKSKRRVRKLWKRGIPPSVRGAVWSAALGNDLGITRDLYTQLLDRARKQRSELEHAAVESYIAQAEAKRRERSRTVRVYSGIGRDEHSGDVLNEGRPRSPALEAELSSLSSPIFSSRSSPNLWLEICSPSGVSSSVEDDEAALAEAELAVSRADSVSVIDIDLNRTFPDLRIFQTDGPLHDSLRRVLEAYVAYRPDVGYVQVSRTSL